MDVVSLDGASGRIAIAKVSSTPADPSQAAAAGRRESPAMA